VYTRVRIPSAARRHDRADHAGAARQIGPFALHPRHRPAGQREDQIEASALGDRAIDLDTRLQGGSAIAVSAIAPFWFVDIVMARLQNALHTRESSGVRR
jgi:hypothetical protein